MQRGEADLVLRLLQRRCGVVSIDRQDLVRSLTIAQLAALGEINPRTSSGGVQIDPADDLGAADGLVICE